MNLVLIIDGRGSFKGSLEGTKRFGGCLGNIEYKRGTPNGPVFPISSCKL